MRIVFEKVRDSEGASFAFNRVSGAPFSCPYHLHPEVELLQVLAGQGHLVAGDHVGRFLPGDLLMLGAGLPHMLRSDHAAPCADGVTLLRYIQFRPEDFGRRFWDLREMHPVVQLLGQAGRGLRFTREAAAQAAERMDRLWAAEGSDRVLSLLGILTGLAASGPAQTLASQGYASPASHRDSERLDRAMGYIGEHLTEGLDLGVVAAAAGLAPNAFSRFFHRRVGVSYIDYVIAMRVGLACRHLLETDGGVAEIAFRVGFNNLSNFNRQFRRLKGWTPREFRRQGNPVPIG